MSLRFAFLGSGSRGNALLVETANVRVLLDCGFAAREVEARLSQLAVDPATLDAILVTHEHGDHIRGVGAMARRHQLPVWMTPGTFHSDKYGALPDLQLIDCHAGSFSIGDISVLPYPVPHDSREPCQFVFTSNRQCLGVLTDVGHITPHITQILKGCDSLVLEFNQDSEMLANGPYPRALQARVGGALGHLSNQQALQLLNQLPIDGLSNLVASHISEKNNSVDLVKSLITRHLPQLEARLSLAAQHTVSEWFSLQ
ncbi:MAG: MBL fold metallo-hydrolase [Candidatus Thiodiazotropha sp. 4PDIV1]